MNTIHQINSKQRILVLGGRGFIGSHVAKHLKLLGANVTIATRDLGALGEADNNFDYQQIVFHELRALDDIKKALKNVDVVVNAVGILRERKGETYDQVHHQSVKMIAGACADLDIRFVHISALGLTNPFESRFTRTKLAGETALRESDANWALVRPSLVDGDGGFGASWFRRVAKWPIQFIPASSKGEFSPVNVDDLGEAVARIALRSYAEKIDINRVYELGGDDSVNLKNYLTLLRPYKKPAVAISIPSFVARLVSHMCDSVHLTPFSFGHYELLKYQNVPNKNRLAEVLGRKPRVIEPNIDETRLAVQKGART